MKFPSVFVLLAAVVALAVTACGTFNAGPFVDAGATIGVSKLITNSNAAKRAERVVALELVAASLDNLNIGDVTRAAVDAILSKAFKKDPEFAPLVSALILGFFPENPAAEQAGELARVAKRVANDIRAGVASAAAAGGPTVVR